MAITQRSTIAARMLDTLAGRRIIGVQHLTFRRYVWAFGKKSGDIRIIVAML